MFAFGLVDERRGCMLLARDRVGIKPLFLFRAEGVLAFASEVKALLLHPECPRGLNADVLGEHLTFRNVAGAQTLFNGIEQLVPGHRLLLDRELKEHRDATGASGSRTGTTSGPKQPASSSWLS